MQVVTIKKNSVMRVIIFALILAMGFGIAVMSRGKETPTTEVKLYFVDAEMLRLIPVNAYIPQTNTEKMAQCVLDELIEGRDDNPKIRRLIPKQRRCMTVEVRDSIAYVDIKSEMVDAQPDGRNLELLTVYSVVNSLTGLAGIENVRFTVEGKVQKDFKGYIDMRETFIPDYYV
ncbi:MAG: GerMN domain-containing protein [Oscillospiraceae bacterium]|nr:GerMN domain-containing protein [Oscillospiraceae bacterium]